MLKKIKTITGNLFSDLKWKSVSTWKKLSIVSVILLIWLDLFLFTNLLEWMEYQWEQVNQTHEVFPNYCLNSGGDLEFKGIFYYIDNNFSKEKFVPNFWSSLEIISPLDSRCEKINELWKNIKEDEKFIELWKKSFEFSNLKTNLKYRISDLEYDKNIYKREYDDYLKENRSWITSDKNRLSNIEDWNAKSKYEDIVSKITEKNTELNKIEIWIEKLQESVLEIESVKKLKNYLQENNEQILKDVKSNDFWYEVKIWLLQLILILPVFLVSIFFYSIAVKRDRLITRFIFSHLSVISWVFLFWLLFKFVYFLLPKKFLFNVYNYLSSLHLLAIWNYIVTFLGIALFWWLIYISQIVSEKLKKSREERKRAEEIAKEERRKIEEEAQKFKFQVKRFESNKCISCEKELLNWAVYCSYCGEKQFEDCKKCWEKTPVVFDYCQKCGDKK